MEWWELPPPYYNSIEPYLELERRKEMKKKWYHSKGFWLGVLIVAGGVAEYIAGMPASASIATIVAGVFAVIIRVVTNKGLIK